MVLLVEGSSEIDANQKSNLSSLSCLRNLIGSRIVPNRVSFFPRNPLFLPACAICSELPANISTMQGTVATRLQFQRQKAKDILTLIAVCGGGGY